MLILRNNKGDRMEMQRENVHKGPVDGEVTITGTFIPVIVSRNSAGVPPKVEISGSAKTTFEARELMFKLALDVIDTVGT